MRRSSGRWSWTRCVPARRVAEVAAAVEVAEATVYRWIRQDRIDRGELAGTSTSDNAELRAARQRIAELESELAIVKRASALFDQGRVVRPKALFGIVATLAAEGHGTKRVCRLLSVAPSGFFRWRCQPPSARAIRRALAHRRHRRDPRALPAHLRVAAHQSRAGRSLRPAGQQEADPGHHGRSSPSAVCPPVARASPTPSIGPPPRPRQSELPPGGAPTCCG